MADIANQFGINLGNILSQAEDIESARIRNTLARQQMADQEAVRDARNVMATNKGLSEPQIRLITMDPAALTEAEEAINSATDAEREEYMKHLNAIGGALATIKTSDKPDELWQTFLKTVPPEVQQQLNMPANYDEDYVNLALGELSTYAEVLERAQKASSSTNALTGPGKINQDLAAGNITADQAERLMQAEMQKVADDLNESTAGREIESADTNAIYRQAAGLYGGMMDEQGNLRALDPTVMTKVQAVATRASQLWVENPAMSHAEAVQKAKEEVDPGGAATPAPGAGGGNVMSLEEWLRSGQ